MKTVYSNIKLIFRGDTVLLLLSVINFLASVANATQWPVLRAFRFCGICTLLFGLTFFLFTLLELRKEQRPKRTILAAVLFFATIVVCLSSAHISIERTQ